MNASQSPQPINHPTETHLDLAGGPAGPDSWVAQAIAEQEEHIKRWRSCQDTLGLAHSWDRFAGPRIDGEIVTYEACWRCRVTRTREDYARKLGRDQGEPGSTE